MLKNWKFALGIACLVLSFFVPFAGFWVGQLQISVAVKGIVIGLLALGLPELLLVIAAALLGKETIGFLKDKAWTLIQSTMQSRKSTVGDP